MQRVRVGITGLAAILLIVALATAIATGVRRSANATDAAAAVAPVGVNASNTIDKSEPLAQLGVTPPVEGKAPAPAAPAPAPAPAAPPPAAGARPR